MSVLYKFYIGHAYGESGLHTAEFVHLEIKKALEVVGIHAATVYQAVGYWEGKQEPSTVVELIGASPWLESNATLLAARLRLRLEQEVILVTKTPMEVL